MSAPLTTKEEVNNSATLQMNNNLKTNIHSKLQPSSSLINCKPNGYEFYKKVLKSPRFVVAPMVDASELAWRILSRYYGAELCFTPMIHSGLFSNPKNSKYRQEQFDLTSNEEGHPNLDRPLILQFCANQPDLLLKSSQFITSSGNYQPQDSISSTKDTTYDLFPVDGFDLNLGCPQGIAKKGKYGAFLMEHLDLIDQLISNLNLHSPIPITAKYRRFETSEKTQEYTSRLISAGAQIVTIHGRTREQKGQFTGLADWNIIKSAVQTSHKHEIPIFGNGNILTSSDVLELLNQTGVDGVMSAEGNLYNPAIFASLNPKFIQSYREQLPEKFKLGFNLIDEEYQDPTEEIFGTKLSLLEFPNSTKVASQYLMICKKLLTRTSTSAIKGHLYKLFRPVFETGRFDDLRDQLAQISWSSKPSNFVSSSILQSPSAPQSTSFSTKIKDRSAYETILDCFQEVVNLIKIRLEDDRRNGLLNEHEIDMNLKKREGESTVEYLKRLKIPYSRCQPYVRPGTQSDQSRIANSAQINMESNKEEDLVIKVKLDEKDDNNSDAEQVRSKKEDTMNGLPKCENPNGCVNSGAIKCKWKLCKTCCGLKTGFLSSNATSFSLSSEESRINLMKKLDDLRPDLLPLICDVHLKRAKLELEKIQLKSQKRKNSKSSRLIHDANKRSRISE